MRSGTTEIEQVCPECQHAMTLVHRGQFSTLLVCPTCGSTLTIPPPVPVVLVQTPPG